MRGGQGAKFNLSRIAKSRKKSTIQIDQLTTLPECKVLPIPGRLISIFF